MKKLGYLFFICIVGIICYLVGVYFNPNVIQKDIYLEGELYTFRDNNGRKLNSFEKDGIVYVPIVDDYLLFDYSVNLEGNTINLESKNYPNYIDINTKTIDGISFTNEDFLSYDFTIFLNWSTWCPDCKAFLSNMSENILELENQNIQFVGLLMDNNIDDVEKILSSYNLSFKNLILTDDLKEQLQSNILNIPSVVVVDTKGKIVYNNEEVDLLFESIFSDLENLELCGEC